MTEQQSLSDIEYELINELEAKYNGGPKPSIERRYYIYGYLNADRGRMSYSVPFFKSESKSDSNDDALRDSFFAGVKQGISDSVALGNGLSDGYQLISDETIKYSKWKEQAFQIFIDAVADGYCRIFKKEHLTEQDVHAFILAAGEHARRNASSIQTIPRDMPWTHPFPTYYSRTRDAIHQLTDKDQQHRLLINLIESLPHHADKSAYQHLFDSELIGSLIEQSTSLNRLVIVQSRLENQLSTDPALERSLKQRATEILRDIMETGNNQQYSYYSEYRPHGLIEPILIKLEQEFQSAAREISVKNTGRVFVVFNKVTGTCIIDRTAEDLKTGFPVAVLKSQEQMPDLYLPPTDEVFIPDTATDAEREQCLSWSKERTKINVNKRYELYAKLRQALPQVDATIAQMNIC